MLSDGIESIKWPFLDLLEGVALSNQRQEIVDRTAGLDVQVKVSQIKDTLKSLQEEMAQQFPDLS